MSCIALASRFLSEIFLRSWAMSHQLFLQMAVSSGVMSLTASLGL